MSGDGQYLKGQVTNMAKKARKDDEEDQPRRYRTALEEIRHELRELWGGPPYDRGDKLPATLAREECRQLMTAEPGAFGRSWDSTSTLGGYIYETSI